MRIYEAIWLDEHNYEIACPAERCYFLFKLSLLFLDFIDYSGSLYRIFGSPSYCRSLRQSDVEAKNVVEF